MNWSTINATCLAVSSSFIQVPVSIIFYQIPYSSVRKKHVISDVKASSWSGSVWFLCFMCAFPSCFLFFPWRKNVLTSCVQAREIPRASTFSPSTWLCRAWRPVFERRLQRASKSYGWDWALEISWISWIRNWGYTAISSYNLDFRIFYEHTYMNKMYTRDKRHVWSLLTAFSPPMILVDQENQALVPPRIAEKN
jgi:hypothetical protein